MHNDTQVTKNKQPKPDVLMLYNHTKGHADVANLVSEFQHIKLDQPNTNFG